ncbi:MAG: adenylyl-sulfate kinase [Methylococcaceae bacterium]|nr:adenylyl-sulfate kinase [Methylococcaceae bacterium]
MSKTISQPAQIVWHPATITRHSREQQNNHRSVILWFTGLSGAGKSTLAHAVEDYLYQQGMKTCVLDGDNIRHGLCADLGFSDIDRKENIRRIGEVAKLMLDAGLITLTAFISPFATDRATVRRLVQTDDFIEIYCYCPLTVCETRDIKGLYKKARQGEIPEFTGISSPYEAPEQPELKIDTHLLSIPESVACIIDFLNSRCILPSNSLQNAYR